METLLNFQLSLVKINIVIIVQIFQLVRFVHKISKWTRIINANLNVQIIVNLVLNHSLVIYVLKECIQMIIKNVFKHHLN